MVSRRVVSSLVLLFALMLAHRTVLGQESPGFPPAVADPGPGGRPMEASTISRSASLAIGTVESLIIVASVLLGIFGLPTRRKPAPPAG